jgi:hypothetical protein
MAPTAFILILTLSVGFLTVFFVAFCADARHGSENRMSRVAAFTARRLSRMRRPSTLVRPLRPQKVLPSSSPIHAECSDDCRNRTSARKLG